ncbi:hypothetical protein JCM6882_001011 [Rhodosporidiobolus microsporus]
MGLDYFAKTCSAEPSLTAATVWCVAKEGTCCAVCPNTLSSVGTRIGLTFTVFFATAVTVVDGAEAPFIFLTTAVQALAYVGTVLFYGTGGSGISRFHAYYALFASLGFLCPLAAISITAAWYLYGGSHGKIGQKLLDTPADAGRRDRKKRETTSHSLGRIRRDYLDLDDPSSSRKHGGLASFTMRSLGASFPECTSHSRGPYHLPSSSRDAHRPLNHSQPFNRGDTSTDNSPVIRPDERPVPALPQVERRSRRNFSRPYTPPGHVRDEESALESPELLPSPHLSPRPARLPHRNPHANFSRPSQAPNGPYEMSGLDSTSVPLEDRRATPAAFLPPMMHGALPIPEEHTSRPPHHPPSPFESPRPVPPLPPHPHRQHHAAAAGVVDDDDVPDLARLPDPALSPSSSRIARVGSSLHRRRSSRQNEHDEAGSEGPSRRPSIASVAYYTDEQLNKIRNAAEKSAWRRWGMLSANVALFVLWLMTFLFVHEVFGSFKLIQKDCEDPTGTKLLIISVQVFLGLTVFVLIVLFFTIRLIFDYSRNEARWSRSFVPGIFSGIFFALWLTLLWVSYSMAAKPDSSLLAGSEEAATFPTVLSIALCIKPMCDIAKAFMKKHKAKRRDAKAKAQRRTTNNSQNQPPIAGSPAGSTSSIRRSHSEQQGSSRSRSFRSFRRRPATPDTVASRSPHPHSPEHVLDERRSSEIGSNDDGSQFSVASEEGEGAEEHRGRRSKRLTVRSFLTGSSRDRRSRS